MGFYSRAAAHKPKITMCNAKRLLEWKHFLWSVESRFTIWQFRTTNLGLADARRTLPAPKHSANCKVWWRRNSGLGLFLMDRVRPLSFIEGKSNRYSIQ